MKSLVLSALLFLASAVPLLAQVTGSPGSGAGGSMAITTSKSRLEFFVISCAGQTSAEDTLTVFNTGSAPVELTLDLPPLFEVITPTSPFTLAAGAGRQIRVRHTPGDVLSATGTLNFSAVGQPLLHMVELEGRRDTVDIIPSARLIRFPDLLSCQRSNTVQLRLTNNGTINGTIRANVTPPFSAFPPPPYVLQPGRSIDITLTFETSVNRTFNGVFIYTVEPCNTVDSVVLEGERVDPSYSVAGVDFGDVTVGGSGTASAAVTNNNNTAIRITGARVAPAIPDVTVDAGQFPIRIPAGGRGNVALTFAPTALGDIPSGVLVEIDVDSICRNTLGAGITGRGIRGGVALSKNELVFGDLLRCESSEDTVQIRNAGNAPVDVSAPVIDPPAAAAFYAITPGGVSPRTLQPGDSYSMIVRFTPGPGADGPVNGVIKFTSSDPLRPELEIPLTGGRIGQALVLEGTDFTPVFVGTTGRSSRRLVNTGSAPVTITSLPIASPFSLISTTPSLPATLAPGDTLAVELEFIPLAAGNYIDSLRVTGTTPCDQFAFEITALAEELVQATIRWGDASEEPGGIVRIPLLLDNDVTRADVTTFTASARFNPTLLIPQRVVLEGTLAAGWTLTDQKLAPGRVEFTAQGASPLGGPGTLAYLDARVMLGDSVATFLHRGDSMSLYSAVTRLTILPGLFTLDGYCDDGGPRLVRGDGAFGLKRVRPNPVHAAGVIEFETTEHGPTSLLLFDALGRHAATILEGDIPPGHHLAPLDAGSLPGGIYYLELRGPTQRERTAVVVGR